MLLRARGFGLRGSPPPPIDRSKQISRSAVIERSFSLIVFTYRTACRSFHIPPSPRSRLVSAVLRAVRGGASSSPLHGIPELIGCKFPHTAAAGGVGGGRPLAAAAVRSLPTTPEPRVRRPSLRGFDMTAPRRLSPPFPIAIAHCALHVLQHEADCLGVCLCVRGWMVIRWRPHQKGLELGVVLHGNPQSACALLPTAPLASTGAASCRIPRGLQSAPTTERIANYKFEVPGH
jgi:hypothetical protein